MNKLLATTLLASFLAVPAFADSSAHDMTCGDYMAMDSGGQMGAVASMSDNMAADNMSADSMASDDMASDAMSSDDMASDAMSSDAMASEDMASDDMASSDTAMSQKVADACADNPDMMVGDAMDSEMMSN